MDFDIEEPMNISLSNILCRKSSIGCSSRISYYRSGEGVPFKWEMKPGIAKESPKEELPPLLTPPPALLSLGLPKTCIMDNPKPSTRSRFRIWNKKEKRGKGKKTQMGNLFDLDVFARLEYCSTDSESMTSPQGSSFSSSSSSSLSIMKSRPSRHSSTSSGSTFSEVHGRKPSTILGCFPMHFTKILVSSARRD
ncbi:hypothetical protein Lal_00006461 [Lupinus albus]|uniref:Uncharacterized protein n=1 Tax=Lupinus albus TaxID=3870 RepID=A0A6A5MLJ6_LUPAL|nr:hypothetical protein Lalb_Chr07g0180511 [Lupinus albus]KAF1875831.1 hypothetical protein Lal_00006461 [Lupinus albus]